MAQRLGQAFITISGQLSQLQKDLAQAKSETAAAISNMQARADSFHFSASTSGFVSIHGAATAATVAIAGLVAAAGMIGTKFNEQVESSTVGIAALLAAQGKFTDGQGRELAGREKINAALGMSSDLVKQLQVDNLRTTATFEQLIKAFQVTLAPGLGVGLSVDQVRQYTVAMVQAAAAMQIPLDMMAEETRSLLKGTITPRNTLIATALGITNEDIRKYQNDANGLFAFVMGKLDAFKQFGGILGDTFFGLMSNTKDAVANVLGQATRPFFDDLKAALKEFYDYAVKVDEKTGNIVLNPELLNSVQLLNDGLRTALALAEGVVKALGLAGEAYAELKKSAVTVGNSNAGFAGPPVDDLTNNQRLEKVRDIMQEIKTIQDGIADITRGGEGASLLFAPDLLIKNLNLSSATQALENFRAQMVKAGQDTSEVDRVLQGLKVTMEDSFKNSDLLTEGNFGGLQNMEESFRQSDMLTEGLYDRLGKVAYNVSKAAMSAEEFKKHLQEIGQTDLSSIGKNLETSITELDAKIKAALSGVKPGLQSAVADYAKTSTQLDLKEWNARYVGAAPEVFTGIGEERNKAAIEYWRKEQLFQINESNAQARKAANVTPVDLTKVDQDILRFKERMAKLYQELYNLDMDYETQRLEASGNFYAAEETRINKRVSDQKAAFAKEVADAEQAYIEMQQKLSGKRGSTPEAQAAVAALKDNWDAAKKRAEEYGGTVERNAKQELEIFRQRQTLQGNIDLAQANVSYAELTGNMEDQLRAQLALIEASKQEKIANASKDIPGLGDAYRRLYDEQARIASLRMNGSYWDGMREGAAEVGRNLPTAFDQGREAIRSFQRGIGDAADALAEFCVTGKMDFGSMTQSIIKDLLRMQFEAMLTNAAFGQKGSSGGGLFGFIFGGIGKIFGLGGVDTGGINEAALHVPGRASGGEVLAGKAYLMGEKGPEIYVPKSNGTIIPNNKINQVGSGSPAQSVQRFEIVNPPGQKNEIDRVENVNGIDGVTLTRIVLTTTAKKDSLRKQFASLLGK